MYALNMLAFMSFDDLFFALNSLIYNQTLFIYLLFLNLKKGILGIGIYPRIYETDLENFTCNSYQLIKFSSGG